MTRAVVIIYLICFSRLNFFCALIYPRSRLIDFISRGFGYRGGCMSRIGLLANKSKNKQQGERKLFAQHS